MDNQHKLIRGYRDLSVEEINLINEIKTQGVALGQLCDFMSGLLSPACDARWVAIGKTHLQEGIMALVRAVVQPDSF